MDYWHVFANKNSEIDSNVSHFNLYSYLVSSLKFPNGKTLCDSWLTEYQQSIAMKTTTPFLISLFNGFLISFLSWASSYLQYPTKTEEKLASLPRIFIYTFLNTIVMTLITNGLIPEFYLPDGFPVFNGGYMDFGTMWYLEVGTTIILIMIINTVMPHLIQIIIY